ncbi:YkgJ family cysteine cluster protein [Actibacterium sp. MT2.3-13A]|uniref:YkgJ family cysteine cluster protein n=1 Tax=Actibacterium sp. MT2.3-13A TaxID=2828332 RepID=UPI001BA986D3|nr:YkgJ family cysteine cluster protein [Actibacterium sp. MT2.3-13A]
MTETLDCTACGACCFGGHDRYIVLLPEDAARAVPAAATQEIEGRRYMRMSGGHCAQLIRTEEERLVCGIYAERPTACRAFRAGSFECLKARQHRGALAEAMRRGSLPVAPAAAAAIEAPELPPAHILDPAPGRWRPEA